MKFFKSIVKEVKTKLNCLIGNHKTKLDDVKSYKTNSGIVVEDWSIKFSCAHCNKRVDSPHHKKNINVRDIN